MKQTTSFLQGWMLFLGGFCMGAADLVPGISGGTVAFILGFYHPLLQSLKTLNRTAFSYLYRRQWQQLFQYVEWRFLITLVGGILCAMVLLVHPFQIILEHAQARVYLYAAFMGLVLGSFYVCLRQLQHWNLGRFLAFLIGVVVAFLLTKPLENSANVKGWRIHWKIDHEKSLLNYDEKNHQLLGVSPVLLSALLKQGLVEKDTPVYESPQKIIGTASQLAVYPSFAWLDLKIMGCGALAICALLLPGISGSYILTLLGVYPTVIGAFADFVRQLSHFQFQVDAFIVLVNLAIGIFIGVLCFARGLSYLMKNYPDLSLSLLSGFMIGALRSVWPFWTYSYALQPLKMAKGPQLIAMQPILPQDSILLTSACACVGAGFLLVWTIEKLAQQRQLKVSSG